MNSAGGFNFQVAVKVVLLLKMQLHTTHFRVHWFPSINAIFRKSNCTSILPYLLQYSIEHSRSLVLFRLTGKLTVRRALQISIDSTNNNITANGAKKPKWVVVVLFWKGKKRNINKKQVFPRRPRKLMSSQSFFQFYCKCLVSDSSSIILLVLAWSFS